MLAPAEDRLFYLYPLRRRMKGRQLRFGSPPRVSAGRCAGAMWIIPLAAGRGQTHRRTAIGCEAWCGASGPRQRGIYCPLCPRRARPPLCRKQVSLLRRKKFIAGGCTSGHQRRPTRASAGFRQGQPQRTMPADGCAMQRSTSCVGGICKTILPAAGGSACAGP